MAEPPSFAGAVQVRSASALPATALTDVGAPGAVYSARSRRFGLPVPGTATTFGDASDFTAASICVGV